AGLPAGILNVVPGRGSVFGEAVGRHMDVDMLGFTGSTEVAKQLQGDAGESNMKRLAVEAGGKSANVVFADTDALTAAARTAALGIFYNQGQVCSATWRIFVVRTVYEEFLQRLDDEAEDFPPGDPLVPNSAICYLVSDRYADEV